MDTNIDYASTEVNLETEYVDNVFEILEMLLEKKEYVIFEKAVRLLNTVNDRSILLKLGKLYYKHGFREMAKNELMKSIKFFDVMDKEGFRILEEVYF